MSSSSDPDMDLRSMSDEDLRNFISTETAFLETTDHLTSQARTRIRARIEHVRQELIYRRQMSSLSESMAELGIDSDTDSDDFPDDEDEAMLSFRNSCDTSDETDGDVVLYLSPLDGASSNLPAINRARTTFSHRPLLNFPAYWTNANGAGSSQSTSSSSPRDAPKLRVAATPAERNGLSPPFEFQPYRTGDEFNIAPTNRSEPSRSADASDSSSSSF